jgi:TadE-like protein
MRRDHSTRLGQSLVEFALALPILILLSVAIFDLGRAVYYSSAIHNAAREGARHGIIYPEDFPGMEAAAIEYAIGLGLSVTDVVAVRGPDQDIGGTINYTVKVTVTYTFRPATPLLGVFLPDPGGTLILTGKAIMRTETRPESG